MMGSGCVQGEVGARMFVITEEEVERNCGGS